MEVNQQNNKDMIELLEKVFANVNSWLTFAEAKNGALIAFNIAVIAAIVSSTDFFGKNIVTYIVVIGIVISTAIALLSFWPKEDEKSEKEHRSIVEENLLLYKNIAQYNADDYLLTLYKKYKKIDLITEDMNKLELDYAAEIVYNAGITEKKYERFRCALTVDLFVFGGMVLMLIIA